MYSAWHPIVGECVSEGARRSGKTRLEWINDALREYKDGQLKQYRGYLESIIPDMRDELLSESYGVDGGGADDDLFVEGPEVFDRAAAARDDQHIGARHACPVGQGVESPDCRRDLAA